MLAVENIQNISQSIEWGGAPKTPRRSLARRLPRRTVHEVFAVPLSDNERPSRDGDDVSSTENRQTWILRPGVEIAAIPSSNRNCRHNVFVEDSARLKKFDLPAATCVAVSQRFDACCGDTLLYDYALLLNSGGEFNAGGSAVRAVFVNRNTGSAITLMHRSLARNASPQHESASFRYRNSQSFSVPTAGHYELRFITFVDHRYPGSESQLFVNAVRIVNSSGQEITRLASLSSVGRVRRSIFSRIE